MSVKSKAKKVGWWILRHGWTLGATWLIDRYAKGATARALRDAVSAASGADPKPTKSTKSLQADLRTLIERELTTAIDRGLPPALPPPRR